ncbi:MAG: VOC family protein [Bacteroidota bacterium]
MKSKDVAVMKMEHVALNVSEPVKMAHWYRDHMGLNIVKQSNEAPWMTFMADDSGQIMIEIYSNPSDQVPDYAAMDPLILHLAWISDDPDSDRTRLEKAGATTVSSDHLADGSHLVMMRDPWGVSLQLCKRATPMLR